MKSFKLLSLVNEALEIPTQVVLITKKSGVSGETYMATVLSNLGNKFTKKLVIKFTEGTKSSLDQLREYVKSVSYNKYFVVLDGDTAYFRKIKKGSVVRAFQKGFTDEVSVIEKWFKNPNDFEVIPQGVNEKIDQIGREFNEVATEEKSNNEIFKQSRFFA